MTAYVLEWMLLAGAAGLIATASVALSVVWLRTARATWRDVRADGATPPELVVFARRDVMAAWVWLAVNGVAALVSASLVATVWRYPDDLDAALRRINGLVLPAYIGYLVYTAGVGLIAPIYMTARLRVERAIRDGRAGR